MSQLEKLKAKEPLSLTEAEMAIILAAMAEDGLETSDQAYRDGGDEGQGSQPI